MDDVRQRLEGLKVIVREIQISLDHARWLIREESKSTPDRFVHTHEGRAYRQVGHGEAAVTTDIGADPDAELPQVIGRLVDFAITPVANAMLPVCQPATPQQWIADLTDKACSLMMHRYNATAEQWGAAMDPLRKAPALIHRAITESVQVTAPDSELWVTLRQLKSVFPTLRGGKTISHKKRDCEGGERSLPRERSSGRGAATEYEINSFREWYEREFRGQILPANEVIRGQYSSVS